MTSRSQRGQLLGLFLVAALTKCVPGVDLSQLHPGDGGDDGAETAGDVEVVDVDDGGIDADEVEGDVAPDVSPDGDAEVDDDSGVDAEADLDVEADLEADGEAEAEVETDADADASDVTVGPPARVWGELTTSGSAAGADGCLAHTAGFCLRSDSVDPSAQEMTGGGFRLRGIVVGGGTP